MQTRFVLILFFLVLFCVTPGFSQSATVAALKYTINDTGTFNVNFKDDFSRDTLSDNSHYVRFGPARFRVQGGVLKLEVNATQWHQMELLNILPCFGKKSRISLRARWAGGEGASLFIGTDWRYRHSGRRTHFYIDFNQNRVVGWNTAATLTADVTFKKGEWVNVRIDRQDDTMLLYINDSLKLTQKLDVLSATENTPEESGYGGYFLESDMRPYLQVIEIDDLIVEGEPSPVEFKAVSQSFTVDPQIDSLPYQFSVIYEKELESWAIGQLETSIPYIQKLVQIYGVPPMSRQLGMVSSRGRYYEGGAGYNNRGVVYQKGNNEAALALNSHELAHNWYSYYGKKWLTEGSADFGYFAFQELTIKRLMTASDFLFNLEKYSSTAYLKGVEGFYLDDDEKATGFFSGGMPQWEIIDKTAWKQRVFFYMLYRILGENGFRQLHIMAGTLDHGMSSQEALSFAEKIKGQEYRRLFDGWVFPGKTSYPLQDVFVDSDQDGLSNLDEQLFGTNTQSPDTDQDGYSDRAEISAGYDPLNNKNPGSNCILVDGLAGDWGKIEPSATDPRDAEASEDIKEVSLIVDTANRQVYALFSFWNSVQGAFDTAAWNFYLTMDFDTNSDGVFDYRVNLFYNKNNISNAFKTNGYAGSNWDFEKWTALNSGQVNFTYRSGVLEAAVPLDLIGNPGNFLVYINSGSPAGVDYVEKAPLLVKAHTVFQKQPEGIWKR